MRLWSIHPQYLDSKGIVALWREGLLARKVLRGETKGYRNHPELNKFKKHPYPVLAIERYLFFIYKEARKRGYSFRQDKLRTINKKIAPVKVSYSEVLFEFRHLKQKLKKRNRQARVSLSQVKRIKVHPLMKIKK